MIFEKAIEFITGRNLHRECPKIWKPKPKIKFDLGQHLRLIKSEDMRAIPDRRLQLRRNKCKIDH